MSMNYTKQVIRGSMYYFIGSVIASFIAYLTKLVLVRNLSVEDYGLFFAVLTFVLIFTVFRTLGLSQGLARFIADYNAKRKYDEIKSIVSGAFLMQFVVAIIMVGVLWLFSNSLAANYFNDERAGLLLRLLALYLPLSIIHINFTSIFQGFKKSKLFALGQPVVNGFVLIGSVVGLWLGLEVFAPVIGYLGSFIVFLLIFIFPLLKTFDYFKYKQKNFKKENKELIKFSFPLMITSVGALFITYFDTLMLTYFDTLTSVGIYNIIYPTALLIVMLGSSLGAILMPVVTELWEKKKNKEIIQALLVIQKYLLVICLPIVIVLMTFSEELIRIFFGTEYVAGATAFNVLLIGALFKVFAAVNNQVLISLKESKKTMKMFLIAAIINVILNLILIPKYSIEGAATASMISFLIMLTVSIFFIRKKIRMISPWRTWTITVIIASIIPIMSKIFIRYIPMNVYIATITGLIIGGIIYLGILYKVNIIDPDEITKVLKK